MAKNVRAAWTEYSKYLKYNKAPSREAANLDAKRVERVNGTKSTNC